MSYERLVSEYSEVTPGKWLHISMKNLEQYVVLSPSRDFSPIGVSFAPSIKQALEAIPLFYGDEKVAREGGKEIFGSGKIRRFTFYVYTPTKRYVAAIPSIDICDDVKISGERRVLRKVKAKRVGVIDVVSRETWSGSKIYDLRYNWRRSIK